MSSCVLLALAAVLVICARPAHAQLLRCPHDVPQRCALESYGDHEAIFTVDGLKLMIEFTDGDYFILRCTEHLTLDNPALPRFESQLRFNKVQLKDCPAPRGSYATALDVLNVRVHDKLELINAGNLTAEHLTGLTDVRVLKLKGAELAPRTLAAVQGVRHLGFDNVRLSPGELSLLPRSLELLDLTRMGTDLTADVLEQLPHLVNVTVRVALETPGARVPSALSPALRSLTVFGWNETAPKRWSACALETLEVRGVTATVLPAGWVSACAELRVLRVQDGPQLSALHETSLRGARRLQELRLASCALTALPTGLLDDAVELSLLDLSGNFLKELPSGLFVTTTSLQWLSLAKNRLTTDVYTSLKAVTSLTTLILSHNNLKDSCGGTSDNVRGKSPLKNLTKLTYLQLRRTNASRICRDWRENMPLLAKLDLSGNSFTSVTYADLQFHGSTRVIVILAGNTVTKLQYSQHDYSLVTTGAEPSRAVVALGSALACDCDSYWAARALRERPEHVRLSASCAHGPLLQDVPLEQLVCPAPELCVGTRCECAWRPSGHDSPAHVLRVQCERAGLTRLSDVLAPMMSALRHKDMVPDDYAWQLHFANNRIAELGAVADLPKHLSILDLSNNSLSALSLADTQDLLVDEQRFVTLASNSVDYSCSSGDPRCKLQARQASLVSYDTYTCANGSLLLDASLAACRGPRGLGSSVLVAVVALGML